MVIIEENFRENEITIEDLIAEIKDLETEYNARLNKIQDKIEFIEEFLIRNTRGYYLRASKKM